MRHLSLAIGFALLTSVAAAHEFDIPPVNIEIKVEPSQVRARIESQAEYWLEEILHIFSAELPASEWPKSLQKSAREYVEKSFHLEMDGQPLQADQFICHFFQEPLNPGSSRVVFDVRYPISAVGKRLSGRVQFFSEYRDEKIREKEAFEKNEVFLTHLSIVGEKTVTVDLPYEKPDFDLPLEGLMLTRRQKLMERVTAVGFRIVSSVLFWIVLTIFVVQIYERFFKRKEE